MLQRAPLYKMPAMAPKHDFDLIIAGDGVLALALGHLAAFRKLEVLIVPPLERIPGRKDTFFLTAEDLGLLKDWGLPGHWDNYRISDGGLFRKGVLEVPLPEELRWGLGAEVLEREWSCDAPLPRLSREEGLDVRTIREEDGGVVLEGLSPSWSFTYRCRFLVVFSHHQAVKKLLDLPLAEGAVSRSLCGDFENHQVWQDTYRSEPGPLGAVETYLVGKNTRRFVLPLEKSVEPYTTELLRETLPALAGAPLEEKRRVGEFLWTLPQDPSWIFRKGRILSLTPENCTYPGLPGSTPVLAALVRLGAVLAWSRRAPVKVLDYLDEALGEINRLSSQIRGIWGRFQSLQVRTHWLPAPLRRYGLKRMLTALVRACGLPKPSKEMKK